MKTAQEFIEFFQVIEDDKWTTGEFEDEDGRCCATGHCPESFMTNLGQLFYNYSNYRTVYIVNDGFDEDYPQKTPKARVLAALTDIKNKGG